MRTKTRADRIAQAQKWLIGRYGQNDSLYKVSMAVAFILIIVSWVSRLGWLNWGALILIGFAYWHLFSKKIYLQVRLNRGFERVWLPLTRPFSRLKRRVIQSRHYKFFHCPACHQRIRIPRGHGKIEITCPTCREQFAGKS
ncbi:Zn-Finger Containing protein [Levilactobacillus bambusae]|uniref:Zn-Finger Containing protein n=1 Tax=Levilactobacillus bambusae TaxID=2024736 RepID=UPI001CDAB4B7|nr:Zn-Finger Containing protein [Levilactobacillus bambusae]